MVLKCVLVLAAVLLPYQAAAQANGPTPTDKVFTISITFLRLQFLLSQMCCLFEYVVNAKKI
jgi:hypothetical protein